MFNIKNKLSSSIESLTNEAMDFLKKKDEKKDFSTKPVSSKKDLQQLLKEYQSIKTNKSYRNITFPTVRKVYSGLIANQIVSVQPMTLPTGLLFYLDYSYNITGSLDSSKIEVEDNKSVNVPSGTIGKLVSY